MLDYITINAKITLEQSEIIQKESKFSFVLRATGWNADSLFTTELQKKGIIQVSVWKTPRNLYSIPYSTINATIRAQKFLTNGSYDFSPVIGLIETYLPVDKIGHLEWELQSASFVYYFIGKHIKDYYDFLQRGRDLKNRHLKKSVESPIPNAKNNPTPSTLLKQISEQIYRLSFSSIHKHGKKNTSKGISNKELTPEEQKEKRREERPIYDSVGLEFELSYNETTAHAYEVDIAYMPKKVGGNCLSFRAK